MPSMDKFLDRISLIIDDESALEFWSWDIQNGFETASDDGTDFLDA